MIRCLATYGMATLSAVWLTDTLRLRTQRLRIIAVVGLAAAILVLLAQGLSLIARLTADAYLVSLACLLPISWLLRRRLADTAAPPGLLRTAWGVAQLASLGTRFALGGAAILLGVIVYEDGRFGQITEQDALSYHLSKTCYWVQHASVLPYATHDIRQTTYGGVYEYLILPVTMFGAAEGLLRWLNLVPFGLLVTAVYAVARLVGVAPAHGLHAAVLAGASPCLLEMLPSVKNDLWQAAFVLGWFLFLAVAVHSAAATERRPAILLASLFLGLAVGTKFTALWLLPVAAFYGFLALCRGRLGWRCCAIALASALVALAGLGAGVTMAGNFISYGDPIGPAYVRHIVGVTPSATTAWTQLLRLIYAWVDLPVPALRGRIAAALAATTPWLGWRALLPGDGPPWPGVFEFTKTGRLFTSTGIAWMTTALFFWEWARTVVSRLNKLAPNRVHPRARETSAWAAFARGGIGLHTAQLTGVVSTGRPQAASSIEAHSPVRRRAAADSAGEAGGTYDTSGPGGRVLGPLVLAAAWYVVVGCVLLRWQKGYLRLFLPAVALALPTLSLVSLVPLHRLARAALVGACVVIYLNFARLYPAVARLPDSYNAALRDSFRRVRTIVPAGSELGAVLSTSDPDYLLFGGGARVWSADALELDAPGGLTALLAQRHLDYLVVRRHGSQKFHARAERTDFDLSKLVNHPDESGVALDPVYRDGELVLFRLRDRGT